MGAFSSEGVGDCLKQSGHVTISQFLFDTAFCSIVASALNARLWHCGYIVAEKARGKGIASEMCRHSQREAISHGFRAMQYNLVVSTNEGAVQLWKRHGFEIIGTLPKAYRHPRLGFVDAFVMYKQLEI